LDPDLIARQWLQGLAGDGAGVREGTASAFAVVEFVKGRLEIGWGEIGPALGDKHEFCEGALPEQEVGEALLPASPDEKVDVRGTAAEDLGEDGAKGLLGEFSDLIEAAGSGVDGVARGVVDREAEVEARPAGGGGFRIGDGLSKCGGKAIPAADDAEADAFVDAVRGFGEEVFVEKAEDSRDFGGGALPVGGREREQSQCVNAKSRSGFNDAACSLGAVAVTGGAGQTFGRGPATVAIGDDGDVERAGGLGGGMDRRQLGDRDGVEAHGLLSPRRGGGVKYSMMQSKIG
jgi:hypothetical protein